MAEHIVGIVTGYSQTLKMAVESRIRTDVNGKGVVDVKQLHPTRDISICLVDAVVSMREEGQATYLGRMYPKNTVGWRGGGDGVREIGVKVRPRFDDGGGSNFFIHVYL